MNTQLLVSPSEIFRPDFRHKPEEIERNGRTWGAGLTKTAAEDLLDLLEAHGHGQCQLSFVVGDGFMVMEGREPEPVPIRHNRCAHSDQFMEKAMYAQKQ